MAKADSRTGSSLPTCQFQLNQPNNAKIKADNNYYDEQHIHCTLIASSILPSLADRRPPVRIRTNNSKPDDLVVTS